MSTDTEKLRQKQNVRKYLFLTGIFLLFIGSMWLIFAPSEKDKDEERKNAGFNTELPDPRGAGIEDDKIAAYEQADMRRKQEEKMRTLADFSTLGDEREEVDIQPTDNVPDSGQMTSGATSREGGSRAASFASSASAYRDINATLGSFYEQPREDPEKEALKAEVEELKRMVEQQSASRPGYEDQVALLEKSYELAAKYMPAGGNTVPESRTDTEDDTGHGKTKALPVGLVSTPVVSSLPQPVSDSAAFAGLVRAAGAGFHTAVGTGEKRNGRNAIRACVHGDQTVISGQGVRLRLLEPMRVGNRVLPRNTLLTGEGRIQGERLGITVCSVEYNGNIIPVELSVYDSDGQNGIFIPGSMEANAVREVAANLGQNLGTSISITNQSAKDQFLSELGRGAIQGVSQYISRKMREEKVHLKSGYTLLLYQENNQ